MGSIKRLFLIPAALALAVVACLAGSTLLHVPTADAQPKGVMVYSKTYDASSLGDAAGETTAVDAPGAVLGDFCIASLGVDSVDMTITCTIAAAGSAEIRVQNESTTTHDLASTTARVMVFPHGTR